jgi:drug/metabolite transporter (DMT)-like permease
MVASPSPRNAPVTPRWLIAVAYASMCLIWSSTWTVIKVGLRGAPPLTAVGLRFAIAALLVSLLLWVRRVRPPRQRRFLWLCLYFGVFQMAMPYVLVYWGEQHISSGLTAVLYSTMPLAVAVLARFLLHVPLTRTKLLGIGIGIMGVGLIFSDSLRLDGSLASVGIAAVLLSVFFASLSSVLTKKYAGPYDPHALLQIVFFVAAVLTLGFGGAVDHSNPLRYDGVTWLTILYLATLGSVAAFSLYLWILKRIDVTIVSYQTFIIPILAVLLGWIFLDENIAPRTGLGAILVLLGIAATLRRTASPTRSRP